ncbi:F0F1 ATP synthase subunit B [uncultured Helicobacter sp.]|uniref:F0F1 ATP synthase subunit B n=1 Tax=uncultured Helicobacter sp. TaxID=175537 RepID=UPI00374EEF22
MRQVLVIILALVLPGVVCASGSFEQSDFIPRLINFVLFVAILWYFTFARIKAIFVNRRTHIASQLEEIQNKLHKAQKEKADALKKLEESKARAREIVEIARKEASMISQRFAQQTQAQIQAMIQTMEASMEFEQTKAMREVVESVLSEVVHSKDVQLENKDYVNIITKRIAS